MENKLKTGLLNNIFRVLSTNFWVAIVGFASSFIFPKILTVDNYALYHTFTLYLTYITILHLGFPSGMVINYAGKDYEQIERSQYKSEIIIITAILSFFTVIFIAFSVAFKSRMLSYIALAIIPCDLISLYKALLQTWSKFKQYSILSTILATSIPTVAVLFYLLVGELPGDIYILIYLAINWIIAIYLFVEIGRKIRSVKAAPILTAKNWSTEKTGIAIVLGNYINTLFVSADKQFVKWFFDNSSFAYYSFGMSMQALMTVFITSIAQPLFPAMAQGRFEDKEYNNIKELLMLFGSLSGLAYFATAIIVKHFIPHYVESLDVVGIYFVVFPAMAVVNCLYINLYKIKNRMKQYVWTLAGILMIAILLNSTAIYFYHHFTAVAIATTVTYYIWFFLGIRQFEFLKLSFGDIVYLLIYSIGFFMITHHFDGFVGMFVYLVFIIVITFLFYRNNLKILAKYVKK